MRIHLWFSAALFLTAANSTSWSQSLAEQHQRVTVKNQDFGPPHRRVYPAGQGLTAGQLRFRDDGGRWRDAPAVNIHYEVTVTGLLSRMQITQRFYNPSTEVIEAIYTYPLPPGGVVDTLKVVAGNRVITGEIREKKLARRQYQDAKLKGKRAALVEQSRKNLFSTSVSAVLPGESVEVTIALQGEVDYDAGTFSLNLPTTLTPRYIPGTTAITDVPTTGFANAANEIDDRERINPPMAPAGHGPTVSMEVLLARGMAIEHITSQSHELDVQTSDDGHVLRLLGASTLADRDVLISWQPPSADAPTAALFYDEHQGERYALMMVLPASEGREVLPREVTFIVDESGSMEGDSMVQARAALGHGLNSLSNGDTFNVLAFDDQVRSLFGKPQPADMNTLAKAHQFVAGIQADGGTEMGPALSFALSPTPSSERVSQVLFMTDGAIGNEDALLSLIHKSLGARRLFPVAIGHAPNGGFMREAARFGRGSFTAISQVTEVESKMTELIHKLESPVLTHIQVHAPGADIYPKRMPDLYLGEPLMFAAKLNGQADVIRISGVRDHQDWGFELPLGGGALQSGVAQNWAKRVIQHELDRIAMGEDEDEVRQKVIEMALKFQLVTPYTSLIAVDREKELNARPSRTRPVASAAPHGASLFGNMPSTATPAPLLLFMSAIFGLFAWGLGRRTWRA